MKREACLEKEKEEADECEVLQGDKSARSNKSLDLPCEMYTKFFRPDGCNSSPTELHSQGDLVTLRYRLTTGGAYGDSYVPQNVVFPDKSVYCTQEKQGYLLFRLSNRCCSVSEVEVVAPDCLNYSSPIAHFAVVLSLKSSAAIREYCDRLVESREPTTERAPSLSRVTLSYSTHLRDSSDHGSPPQVPAKYAPLINTFYVPVGDDFTTVYAEVPVQTVEQPRRRCVVRFDSAAISARYLAVVFWSTARQPNVDIEHIQVREVSPTSHQVIQLL
ncbi:hypothetical protein TRVA0_013S01090 [Trichomonascus vanleenenianus]|uniref:uncharacterized protein n=1 Tax=Trichomonascus vanleenenianus TaxID=2268995 RepID=UPI003EC9CD4C